MPSDVDGLAAQAGVRTSQRFADVCEVICAGAKVLSQRPVMTCYYLEAASATAPTGMTLHIPLYPYASTDRIAAERIAALLSQCGLGSQSYLRIADRLMADRGDGSGLHSYVAYKSGTAGSSRDTVTAYFSPTLFQPTFGRLALDPDHFWPSPVN
jgi:hypothetical protein